MSRELRVGLAHPYVALGQSLGAAWLERHLGPVLGHLLELAGSPRAGGDHTEAVLSRSCVASVLAQLTGRQLREKAQLAAAKELLAIIARNLASSMEEAEAGLGQHPLVTALLTLGSLAARLGTLATSLLTDSSLRLLDTVFSGLLHPKHAVRLAAAQCLGQVGHNKYNKFDL